MKTFTPLQFQYGTAKIIDYFKITVEGFCSQFLKKTYLKYSEAADVNGVVWGGGNNPEELLLRNRVLFEASQIASNCEEVKYF